MYASVRIELATLRRMIKELEAYARGHDLPYVDVVISRDGEHLGHDLDLTFEDNQIIAIGTGEHVDYGNGNVDVFAKS